MSDQEKPEAVTFTNLGDAIKFVERQGKAVQESAKGFGRSFKELTGCEPTQPVTALDVVKIFHRLTTEAK
jgi:hypothetical protein